MNQKTMNALMSVPQGSIEAYIRSVNTYPMLTAEEEKALGEKLYYHGDVEAEKC